MMKASSQNFVIRLLLVLIWAVATTAHAESADSLQSDEVAGYFQLADKLEKKDGYRAYKQIDKQAIRPLLKIADRYLEEQRAAEAIDIYQRLYELQKKFLGGYDRKVRSILGQLAYAYQVSHRNAEWIVTNQQVLAFDERIYSPNHPTRLSSMTNLAFSYQMDKSYSKAEALYKKILGIYEKYGMTGEYGYTRVKKSLSDIYIITGDMAKAEPYYKEAVTQKDSDQVDVANMSMMKLSTYVYLLQFSGKFAESEKLYKEMLRTLEQRYGENDERVALVLLNLGSLYNQLGVYGKALEMKQRAYRIYIAHYGKDHLITAYVKNSLAETYLALKDYQAAVELLEQAKPLFMQQIQRPDRLYIDKKFVLINLAIAYMKTNRFAEAERIYQQILAETSKEYSPQHPMVAYTRMNLAELYYARGKYNKAKNQAAQALAIIINKRAPYHLANAYFLMAKITRQQDSLAEAIFYGKQSINLLQGLRRGLSKTEKSLQAGFIASQQENYEILAGWLIDAGRLPEAEQVLAMLKEEEYYNFIRRSAQADSHLQQLIHTTIEQQSQQSLVGATEMLAEVSKELAEFEKADPATLNEKDKARYRQLQVQHATLAKDFQATLLGITQSFRSAGDKLLTEQVTTREYQQLGAQLESGVALVHFLPLQRSLRIILRTRNENIARRVDITAMTFNQAINTYRKLVTRVDLTSARDQQKLNQAAVQLYKWLIQPLQADLARLHIRTLIFYKNGSLRYIPLATLYDGKQYLIEHFAVANYTAAARQSLMDKVAPDWTIAGMGVSKQYGEFSPLRMVPYELDSIIKKTRDDPTGAFAGKIYVNEKFTSQQLKNSLTGRYNVTHIATHYKYMPGTEADSFLLLGDGSHLSLATLRSDHYNFSNIDLLTLSACETAVTETLSDGREVEGLATLVQRQGARGVLATLWPVADCSTGVFMQRFYQYRRQGESKAAALRQTQLDFIHGKVAPMRSTDSQGCQPISNPSGNTYQHPYFWAPFILMGNWK
ncbi:MAG: CHAT domain-containing protein [Thioalkalispiraceae bacterium]|jgi:CHAT domain-containing protein